MEFLWVIRNCNFGERISKAKILKDSMDHAPYFQRDRVFKLEWIFSGNDTISMKVSVKRALQ